jgi:hypothetical protein
LAAGTTDKGFGVIKPSGSDQTVALISGDRIVIQPPEQQSTLHAYRLNGESTSTRLEEPETLARLQLELDSFLQIATQSLLGNTTGAQTPTGSGISHRDTVFRKKVDPAEG